METGTKYIFTLQNKNGCPQSCITFESPIIYTEEQKQNFLLKVTENVIRITEDSNFTFNYDPNDLTPIFTFDLGPDSFIVSLGPNPMIVINNVVQLIPPSNIFSYEYFDNNNVLRKKTFTFFNSFFTIKDEDSSLIYYSDLKIVRYENFDL